MRLAASLTDVRRSVDLGDYTGELEGRVLVRITDRGSGGAAMEAATVVDTALRAPLGCAATPATDEGSTCATVTSVNAAHARHGDGGEPRGLGARGGAGLRRRRRRHRGDW